MHMLHNSVAVVFLHAKNEINFIAKIYKLKC